jgi:hypothetical protein
MSKQTVYNILASAKPVKVDLAIVDELKSSFEEVKKLASSWESASAKLTAAAREISEYAADADGYSSESYSKFAEVIKIARNVSDMAKELGVEPPQLVKEIFAYSDLEQLTDYTSRAKSSISNSVK